MEQENRKEPQGIAEKDWLDLSWKYFQQHAQQRISYFNFFVIFSTILTTGIVSTYQKTFGLTHLGFPLGLLQVFLAFMFYKLDERNKLLTKQAEKMIRYIETTDNTAVQKRTQLFSTEEKESNERKEADQKIGWHKRWYKRMLTHSDSYRIIYITFMAWGVIGALLPFCIEQGGVETNHVEASIIIKYSKSDSLQNEIRRRDSVTTRLFESIETLSAEVDSLEIYSKLYQNPKK